MASSVTRTLQTATTAGALAAGGVGRDRGDVLDAANLHTRTGEGAESGLRAGARGLGAHTTDGAHLHVQGGDAALLAAGHDVLGGHHGSVGGRLIAIGLHLHTAGDLHVGFAAGRVRHVHEGVVEGGEDVHDAVHKLVLRHVRAVDLNFLLLGHLVYVESGSLGAP